MNDNNLFSSIFAVLGASITSFYAHLAPWLLLGMILVIADLRFGIMAAKKRGEKIRFSRAIRRTINKMVDYLCWVTLAEVCSMTFEITIGVPVISMGMLFIIYGIEINSCVNNYLEYKGIKKKFNFYKLVGKEELLDDVTEEKRKVTTIEEREVTKTSPKDDNQ
ncbi:phage holin family protein [Paramuribaculum intestinale]|uniref:phage holin family protein n=1 Tax=Paramuribaculum intestinale TaxID=2094151 RepID=UPI002740F474|nr:phage holin family protein [Paramuribaculum intestinale]WLT41043.1 phage holin family protein [Paramuribaculum intestinale]